MTIAHLILEGKRVNLERRIDFHLDTIDILEKELAEEQEKLHQLMAQARELEDALSVVAA